jgi:hypothetical protein
MPYIIETHRTSTTWAGGIVPVPAETTRQAVATLEEARGSAGTVVNALPDDVERVRPFYDAIVDLSESGGTIGPLPDGTIIEVRQVDWESIAPKSFDDFDGHAREWKSRAIESYNHASAS